MTDDKITVGLVDDQLLFRQGMKAILSAWNNIEIIFECADGFSVIDKLNHSAVVPQVMLIDLSLPPHNGKEFSGKEVTTLLRQHFPEIKVVILSGHDNENFIAQLIESGAHGYLVKDSDPGEVYEAIRSAHQHGSYINAKTLRAIQNNINRKTAARPINSSNESLSKREEEILQLICMQFTTEAIADKLFISPKTVNNHRNSLLQKTGAHNVAGLVMWAVKNGVVKV